MIEVKDLVKTYGTHKAVKNVSFKVEEGKIYGFLGPNGAGKSTTMNIITGTLAATSGTVTINGHDIYNDPIEAKRCIGYLPEIPPLYPDMTPEEYLSFVGSAKGLRGVELYNGIDDVIEKTGLYDVRNRLIKNLSKGYKQRVGIAQAMLGDPEIIILDEPTVGLDPLQIIEIRDLIRSLGKSHTVILSSHILTEVAEVCDKLIIISKGRIVADGEIGEIEKRFSGMAELEISLRASYSEGEKIKEQLLSVVSDCSYSHTGGVATFVLKYSQGTDPREAIYSIILASGLPLLSMIPRVKTLEDIFIALTSGEDISDIPPLSSDIEGEAAEENVIAKPQADDDDGDDDDDDDDGDGEDYKPLFS